MNPYIGKTCPYCKGEIHENDDVVVCSKCEMPHHKECWIENEGCTTFGCDGTIQNIPAIAPDMFKTSDDVDIDIYGDSSDFAASYCPKCGSARIQTDRFCGHCGYDYSTFKATNIISNSYVASTVPEQTTVNSEPQSYFATPTMAPTPNLYSTIQPSSVDTTSCHSIGEYVDHNIPYYEQQTSGNYSFNWAAFWFGGYWYAYRKMFGKGFLFALLVEFITIFGGLGLLIAICIKIYIGKTASETYIATIKSYQQEEKKLDANLKQSFFNKHKGTSMWYPILIVIIISCIAGIATTLLQ